MQVDRRSFGLGALAFSAACSGSVPARARTLDLLVLGGTNFVGPATVDAALSAGHRVTLFNRGKSNPGLFPQLERIRGDRDLQKEDLKGLEGDRRWDAIIDVWPADPAMTERTARLLENRVQRYVYISSISAYAPLTLKGATEAHPLVTSAANPDDYGFAKAETERRLQAIYGARFTSLRPPPILGWRNDGKALASWAVRMARGGDVVAVGDATDHIQFTDVKDVGDWAIRVAERALDGPFNVIGPARPMSFPAFLERIRTATGARATLVPIPYDFLVKNGITEFFTAFPLYRPHQRARTPGFYHLSSERARAAGLRFRDLARTVNDELRWFAEHHDADFDFGGAGLPPGTPYWLRSGLSRREEQALIQVWRERQSTAGD